MAINASSASVNPDSGDTRSFPTTHKLFLVDPDEVDIAGSWQHLWNDSVDVGTTFWAVVDDWNQSYQFLAGGTEKAELTLWPGVHIARINHHGTSPGSITSYLKRNDTDQQTGPAYIVE